MRIKDTLHKLLFPKKAEELALMEMDIKVLESNLINTMRNLEKTKPEASYTLMMRELLKGFDPTLVDFVPEGPNGGVNATDILEEIKQQTGSDGTEFLAGIKEAYKNDALRRLDKFLIRNQIVYSAREAETLDQINFGRATVNGLVLRQGEIDRLYGVYLARHPDEEPYDKFSAL